MSIKGQGFGYSFYNVDYSPPAGKIEDDRGNTGRNCRPAFPTAGPALILMP